MSCCTRRGVMSFLSTPSARRATSGTASCSVTGPFLSTPSARRATEVLDAIGERQDVFLSTPSARRATAGGLRQDRAPADFYPRPPRGGRPGKKSPSFWPHKISIHALREEGDLADEQIAAINEISIHALREEGDTATTSPRGSQSYFYPRPPRGGRPDHQDAVLRRDNFYPRPPRGGRRAKASCRFIASGFLSTPSARRATA